MIEPLSAFTGTTRPAAPEEKDEGKDEEPISKPEKSVDEQEDKKEEYDEDGDEDEKASVDVIKPVPGPEETAPKTEPTGQNLRRIINALSYLFVRVTLILCFVIPVCPCMHSAKTKESPTKTAKAKGL